MIVRSKFLRSVVLGVLLTLPSYSALTPEEETRKIAQHLKPISDEIWTQIAGEKANQNYQIVKGDTLFDISKRLFGDPKYWPKIWALNNGKILNPHLIFPGNQVAFLGGTGISLPAIQIATHAETESDADPELGLPKRSQEWRSLPRQSWEVTQSNANLNIDPLGFDKNSIIKFNEARGFEPESWISTDELPFTGKITGSRKENYGVTMTDTVYVEPMGDLQIGETYTLTTEPERIQGKHTQRKAYSYQNLGSLKILGVRDGLFVGTVSSVSDSAPRGTFLMPLLPRLREPIPIPGPAPLRASISVDPRISTSNITQFKMVYIDRGTKDGVEPGMVFRAYQHLDPSNGKVITESDFVINSDFLVVQVTESFCMAWTINSFNILQDRTPVLLLTDVTDVTRARKYIDRMNMERGDELDELDQLDPGGPLGKKEERELKQLERWKEGGENPVEETVPDEALPEPPAPPQEGTPAEGMPSEDIPSESAPSEDIPPESAPESVPAEGVPVEAAPSEQVPTAPLDEAPSPSTPPSGIPEEPPPPPEVMPE